MNLTEYATYDALGLAELVARKQVTPKELALTCAKAIEATNPTINAVVETYPDRIEAFDEKTLGNGPFRGVPLLIKDVFGHEKGRKIEFGSRLCEGMTAEVDSHVAELFRASGVNILGRSAAPEYSMSASTESAMFGNTSNPWKKGYSAGGSSGGAQAAVTSGMVPIAHGSDIGGSIRIPASLCGGVGLKPSRGRISIGPVVDEGGFGYSMNFIQAKTVRDAAAMLDCLAHPQPGDPFIIPKPGEPYAQLAAKPAPKLRIGMVLNELVGVKVDPEVAKAVEAAGKALAAMGHTIEPASADMGGEGTEGDGRSFLLRLRFAPRRLRQARGHQARAGYARAGDLVSLPAGERNHAGALHGLMGRRQHRAPQARRVLYQARHLALTDHVATVRAVGQLQSLQARRDGAEQCAGAVQDPLPVHHPPQHHGHAGHVVAARNALFRRADRGADRGPPGRRAPPPATRSRARAGDAMA